MSISAGAALAAPAGCLGATDGEPPPAYATPVAAEFDAVVETFAESASAAVLEPYFHLEVR